MKKPILFLDIDGVLNGHGRHPNGYCGINPDCVYRLNKIVYTTKCDIVISSAWRYLVHENSMTLLGFRNMLCSYGLCPQAKIAGCTARDENVVGRGPQILRYLRGNSLVAPYVVLDDGSDKPPVFPEIQTLTESLNEYHAAKWIKTKSDVGLTDDDVDKAIEILGCKPIRTL